MDITVQAAVRLNAIGQRIRVVSMPSTSVFDQQEDSYKEQVLPGDIIARIAIETSHVDYWRKYVGLNGAVIGMTSFGESAPGPVLLKYFGFTVEHIVNVVQSMLRTQSAVTSNH